MNDGSEPIQSAAQVSATSTGPSSERVLVGVGPAPDIPEVPEWEYPVEFDWNELYY